MTREEPTEGQFLNPSIFNHQPTISLPVSGMTCAACSARVQRALETAPGVEEASVNLMTNCATVSYDPQATTPEQLVETIRSTGYGAELPAPGTVPEDWVTGQDAVRAREVSDLRRKFQVSATAAVLVMILTMPLAQGGSVDPFMRIMMPASKTLARLVPGLYALSPDALRFLLLALTVPVGTFTPEPGPLSGITAPT